MEDRFDMMEETDNETEYGQYIMMLVMLEKSFELILLSYVFFSAAFGGTGYHNSPAYPRERISYQQLMLTHGSNRDFRKAYRMNKGTFLTLLQLLTVPLIMPPPFPICGAPNGRIAPFIKLSCYLRVSAGGKVSDIGPRHGIATDYVMPCVWSIVDDINSCDDLRINFPSHDEQGVIARAFQVNSGVGFGCCIGAVDGILIKTKRPGKEECGVTGVKKFFCARKNSYGLNMQVVADSRRRILFYDISWPGSASDYLSFSNSSLGSSLETLIASGYALFGDNAYVNSPRMVVPYYRAQAGTAEDNFNFFQSQLRMSIECTFGILVNRFGILHSPLPFSLKSNIALVQSFLHVHNHIIDFEHEDAFSIGHPENVIDGRIGDITDDDGIPRRVMDSGHHFDDVVQPRYIQTDLRDSLRNHVVTSGLMRPGAREEELK